MGDIQDGYGNAISEEYLLDNVRKYRSFTDAAAEINPDWTRHFIHKYWTQGLLKPEWILILTDVELFKTNNLGGKKQYYIHIDGIEKIRFYESRKTKRNHLICRYCKRHASTCRRRPCKDRTFNEQPLTEREKILARKAKWQSTWTRRREEQTAKGLDES